MPAKTPLFIPLQSFFEYLSDHTGKSRRPTRHDEAVKRTVAVEHHLLAVTLCAQKYTEPQNGNVPSSTRKQGFIGGNCSAAPDRKTAATDRDTGRHVHSATRKVKGGTTRI